MEDQNDFILRQIRALSEGLAYILSGGKSAGSTEIVFPQKEEQKLPHQIELQQLIDQNDYAAATSRFNKLQYSMSEQSFLKLGLWFYGSLNQINEHQLKKGGLSKTDIIGGLEKLKNS